MCVFKCSIVYEAMEDPLVSISLYQAQMKNMFPHLVRLAFVYAFCIDILSSWQ
jgi:hypothetical protein